MPKLHVLYDPTDNLQTNHPNLPKSIKIAVLDLHYDLTPKEIAEYSEQLATLLLEQL